MEKIWRVQLDEDEYKCRSDGKKIDNRTIIEGGYDKLLQ